MKQRKPTHGHPAIGTHPAPARPLDHRATRAALLLAAANTPELSTVLFRQVIMRLSGGTWDPNPAELYPGITALEDQGLLVFDERGLVLTPSGASYVARHREELIGESGLVWPGDMDG